MFQMQLPNTDLTNLEQIMMVKKTIPSYQRDFVWEKSLITPFLENLWEAFEADKKKYFCGSMVVYKHTYDDVYEIVDGQQRTTVLYILVSVLIEHISKHRNDNNFAGEQRSKYIYQRDILDSNNQHFHFTHRNHKIRDFFKQIGSGDISDAEEIADDIITQNLKNSLSGVNEFVKVISNENGLESILKFYVFILERVSFVHFVAEDINEALLIYSRLNSGGKVLGQLEIIKGKLFGAITGSPESDWQRLEQAWEEFWIKFKTPIKIGGYNSAKSIATEDTFLVYYFLVHYPSLVDAFLGSKAPDGFLPSSKIAQFLLDHKVEHELFNKPEIFLKSLNSFADDLISLRTGQSSDFEEREILTDIALLSQTQTQPLMLLLSCIENKELFKAILPQVFRLVFIFSQSVTGSGSTSNVWKTLAREVRLNKGKKIDEIITSVKNEAQKHIDFYWKNFFVPEVERCNLKTDRRKIKTILLVTEIAAKHLSNVSGDKYFNDFYNRAGFDVDHLMPETLGEDEFIQLIGNAAILGMHDNRALKDKPFESEEKQEALKKSDILSTRAIVTSQEKENGAKKSIMTKFTNITKIDEESVEKRKNEILNLLAEFFEIS